MVDFTVNITNDLYECVSIALNCPPSPYQLLYCLCFNDNSITWSEDAEALWHS